MEIDIAVAGKFHAFRLAEEFKKKGYLGTLYTTYPKFKISPRELHGHSVSFPFLEGLLYLTTYIKPLSRLKYLVNLPYFRASIFDMLTQRRIGDVNNKARIFYGWNGSCLQSLKKAKSFGAVTYVDRACPHIEDQLSIIRSEVKMLGGKDQGSVRSRLHERMIQEYELADYIVVPSEYSRRSFLERGFKVSQIKIVPLAGEKVVPYKDFTSVDGQFRVLFIGGNFYRKGLYYLLLAWERLKLKKAELIIRGHVPDQFRNLINIGNTRIIPPVPIAKLVDLYHQASILCLPSIDDGFGMVVPEAMASGTPVIITENVGAADIIRPDIDGFIIPIRDPTALSEKILSFYENRELVYVMGENANARASVYTWERTSQKLMRIFRNSLNM